MAKTYAPQLVRMLQRVNAYQAKHQVALSSTLTTAQATALASIVAQIQAQFSSVAVNQTP